jgi:zinc protease
MSLRIRATALIAGLVLAAFAATSARAVEVQRVVSDGGIEAWLVEDHSNPIVSLDLAFRGGASLDPNGKAGLANVVSGLLDEGAGDLDSQAFQRKLAEDAIKLSFDAGRDSFRGSLRTLKGNLDKAIELLSLSLTQPSFDEEPIRRIKSQILANLARKSQDPSSIANRTLDRVVFPDHPYGRPVEGTQDSVKAVTRADMQEFAATRFARDRLVVGVAGDITPAELKPLLDKAFGELSESNGDLPPVPDVEAKGEGDVVVIEKPVPQSWIAFAHGGIRRDDPDYYAANLVEYVLGGGSFASRLYEEVREKRGLVYSIYTYLQPMDHGALVAGGLGTSNASVGKALSVVREEWRRMAEEGPTMEELADAKTYMTGSFPLRLSSTGSIAGILTAMQLENLGIDYIDRRKELIEKVTLEQARRVAAELLNPENLAVVVVGTPEGVEATRPAPGGSS